MKQTPALLLRSVFVWVFASFPWLEVMFSIQLAAVWPWETALESWCAVCVRAPTDLVSSFPNFMKIFSTKIQAEVRLLERESPACHKQGEWQVSRLLAPCGRASGMGRHTCSLSQGPGWPGALTEDAWCGVVQLARGHRQEPAAPTQLLLAIHVPVTLGR